MVGIEPASCRLAIGQLIAAMALGPPERWDMIDGRITRWGHATAFDGSLATA